MTEKISITQEQADALELYKANAGKGVGWVAYFAVAKDEFNSNYASLKFFTLDTFARLMYEPDCFVIRPNYKLRDYVTITEEGEHQGKVGVINSIGTKIVDITLRGDKPCERIISWHPYRSLRPSTESEIAIEKEHEAWEEIGRKVGEIKEGDVGIDIHGFTFRDTNRLLAAHENKELKGIYPIEKFKEFLKEESK